jgi:hypothetical protein
LVFVNKLLNFLAASQGPNFSKGVTSGLNFGEESGLDCPARIGLEVSEGICIFFTGKSRINKFFNGIFELTGYNPVVFQPAWIFSL